MAFICRFAPSPTGPLHIGGVRTALFNWLLARKNKGKFYLRIEDTDKERSKDEFKKQIIESLSWVGIKHDDKEFIQSKNINKHKEIAEELLKKGFAYKCYCSRERLDELRETQMANGEKPKYDGKCRNAPPQDGNYVIRFLNPDEGSVVIKDHVRGEIEIQNSELDDLIIQRSDGTPTYNFCVVVDHQQFVLL